MDVLLRFLARLDPQNRQPDLAAKRLLQEFCDRQMLEEVGNDLLKRDRRSAVVLDLKHKKRRGAADLHVAFGHAD